MFLVKVHCRCRFRLAKCSLSIIYEMLFLFSRKKLNHVMDYAMPFGMQKPSFRGLVAPTRSDGDGRGGCAGPERSGSNVRSRPRGAVARRGERASSEGGDAVRARRGASAMCARGATATGAGGPARSVGDGHARAGGRTEQRRTVQVL